MVLPLFEIFFIISWKTLFPQICLHFLGLRSHSRVRNCCRAVSHQNLIDFYCWIVRHIVIMKQTDPSLSQLKLSFSQYLRQPLQHLQLNKTLVHCGAPRNIFDMWMTPLTSLATLFCLGNEAIVHWLDCCFLFQDHRYVHCYDF